MAQFIEKRETEIMDGKKWVPSHADPITGKAVYECLAGDLSAQYLKKSQYVKSVKRIQHYTHLEILVTYSTGIRVRYTLPAMF